MVGAADVDLAVRIVAAAREAVAQLELAAAAPAVVDVDALAAQRFLSPVQVGLLIGRDPETVRRALRSGEMHGSQRGRGGSWSVRPACAEAWVDGEPCAHQDVLRRPVSLQERRLRAVGSR